MKDNDHGGTRLTEGDAVSVSVPASQLPHDDARICPQDGSVCWEPSCVVSFCEVVSGVHAGVNALLRDERIRRNRAIVTVDAKSLTVQGRERAIDLILLRVLELLGSGTQASDAEPAAATRRSESAEETLPPRPSGVEEARSEKLPVPEIDDLDEAVMRLCDEYRDNPNDEDWKFKQGRAAYVKARNALIAAVRASQAHEIAALKETIEAQALRIEDLEETCEMFIPQSALGKKLEAACEDIQKGRIKPMACIDHESEIAALRAEIERLQTKLEDAEARIANALL